MTGRRSLVFAAPLAILITATATPRAGSAEAPWFASVGAPGGFDLRFLDAPPPAADRADDDAPGPSKRELCEMVVSSARSRQLPVTFLANLIWQESRFDTSVVSHRGAVGIAQFMPTTAKEMGLDDPRDPRRAIPAAAKLLRSLVDKFGNLGLAAAAYNAGPTRVRAWLAKRSALPAETRHYVVTITGRAADTWRGTRSNAFSAAARAVPCAGVDAFAAATRWEQATTSSPSASPPARAARRGERLAAIRPHERTRPKS